MFKLLRFTLPLILFLGVVLLLWRSLSLHATQIPSPLINQPAPHFQLPTLFDVTRSATNNDFKHHITLLNVWARGGR